MSNLKAMAKVTREIEKQRKRKPRIKPKRKQKVVLLDIDGESYRIPSKTGTVSARFKSHVSTSPVSFDATSSKTGRRGFSKVNIHKKTNLKHTLHILRMETERQLSPSPKLLLSTSGGTQDEIRKQILNLHNEYGRQRNAYMEIFCSFESQKLLNEFMKELEETYNTNVYAVIHNDESVEHVHILISWKNKEGKAIRFQKGEFFRLHKRAIEKLQPSRSFYLHRGEGLSRVPFGAYRSAWLKGQDEYNAFMEKTRKERELFYEFEQIWNRFSEWELSKRKSFWIFKNEGLTALLRAGIPKGMRDFTTDDGIGFDSVIDTFYKDHLKQQLSTITDVKPFYEEEISPELSSDKESPVVVGEKEIIPPKEIPTTKESTLSEKETLPLTKGSTVSPSVPPPGFDDFIKTKKDDEDIAVFKRIKRATTNNVKRFR